jgi:peptide/nickel transport system substrate-binding protein
MTVTGTRRPVPGRSARITAVLAVVALVAALAACGDDPAAESTGGGGFTLAVQSDPQSLDPATATDLPGSVVMVNLYEPLVKFEGDPPEMVMHLAESLTTEDDGATYTATLKPNLTFHDGSPLNADAVVYSMDRLLTMEGGRAAPLLSLLDPGDTTAVDDLTVTFTLNERSAVFPSTLAFFFIVNPVQIEANVNPSGPYGEHGDYAAEWLSSNDAGSGPYTLTARTPNAEMQFEAYENYWGGWEDNQFDTFRIQVASEPASAGLLLREGVVDAIYENYPTSVFDDLENAEGVTVHTDLGLKPMYLFLNNELAPTDNVKFRQALAYAFDYDSALQLARGSERLPGPLPTELFSAVTEPAYNTDLDRARQLLDESGVDPEGVTLTFGSLGGPSSIQNRLAQLFQSNVAPLGIDVEISNHAWADILSQTSAPETTKNVYAIQLSPSYPDPDGVLPQAWATSSHGSWSGAQWYTNDTVDQLISEGRSTLDEAERGVIYQQVQEQIIADSPAIFMMNIPVQVAIRDRVGGYDFQVQYYNYQVYKLFADG